MSDSNNSSPTSDQALSPHQWLLLQLEHHQPGSVLSCSHQAIPAIEQYCQNNKSGGMPQKHLGPDIAAATLQLDERYQLAVIADYLEHHSQTEGEQLIALIRNLYSHHLLVLVQDNCTHWGLNKFLALGLKQAAIFEKDGQKLRAYSYNLDHYNPPRSWNNARFWANPENFGKYWW